MDPDHIMQVGMGFFASKTLLSAVGLGVFTELAEEPRSADALGERLGLHARSRRDFLDGLVALGFLERSGDGPDAVYSNAADAAVFLDRNQPTYIGGLLEMANARLYRFWGRPHRGAANRHAAERGQAHRPFPVRGPLRGPGPARAVPRRDGGRLRRELPRARGEVRLQPLYDPHRRRRRDRTAVDCRRAAPPAPALHELRPACRASDRRALDRIGRCRGSGERSRPRLLHRPDTSGRRRDDGDDPARLGPRPEDAPHPRCVRRAPRRRRVHRRGGHHRRRPARRTCSAS